MSDVWIGRRRGPSWEPVAYGVHVRNAMAGDLRTRLWAIQVALPSTASFTSVTSAALRGWWLPPMPVSLPVFVAAGPNGCITRPGLDVCRHHAVPRWERVDGVRVATPAETLLALARDLSLLDVVVIGDGALHRRDVTVAQLRLVAAQRRRGAPNLRRAIPLMDGRAESIYEGLLRMLHVAGGVEVEPQSVVRDELGEFVARADLRLVGTTRLAEYDGGDHLERKRQRSDLRRSGRLADAGYERRGYTQEDVLYGAAGILRDADRALGREHDSRRLDAWHGLLRQSVFTSAGQQRLLVKLGIVRETAARSPR